MNGAEAGRSIVGTESAPRRFRHERQHERPIRDEVMDDARRE